MLKYKGKYFGHKRPPQGGEWIKLEKKNREEIQFQRKSKKLTMFMSFMDIFPVFYEFLTYFSSYLTNLAFLHNLMLKIENFSAPRAIWNHILPDFL